MKLRATITILFLAFLIAPVVAGVEFWRGSHGAGLVLAYMIAIGLVVAAVAIPLGFICGIWSGARGTRHSSRDLCAKRNPRLSNFSDGR